MHIVNTICGDMLVWICFFEIAKP